MATSLEYIEYVCDCISDVWDVRYKKMFGEYMVYVNDKPVLLVCDNNVYVKKLEVIKELMIDAEVGSPYKDAKERYILEIENLDFSKSVVAILEQHTAIPKKRKKKIK